MPLRKAIRPIVLAVELVNFTLEPADQDLLDSLLFVVLEFAGLCETHRVENFQQSGEAACVAIVRGGRQKELVLKERRDLPERLDELVVLAERRGEQIVGFVNDEKIPRQLSTWATGSRIGDTTGREKLLQDVRLAQVIVGRDNA